MAEIIDQTQTEEGIQICSETDSPTMTVLGAVALIVGIVIAVRIKRGFWIGALIVFAVWYAGRMTGRILSPPREKCTLIKK